MHFAESRRRKHELMAINITQGTVMRDTKTGEMSTPASRGRQGDF